MTAPPSPPSGAAAPDAAEPDAAASRSINARFVSGGLMRHTVEMSLAGSVGLMAIFLVDLADLYFVSLLGQTELAAAIGFAAAIAFFATSVSIGLAIAIGALTARAIGAGDAERARRVTTTSLAVSVAASVVVALAMWLGRAELVALVGAEGETARLAARYLAIVLPTLPFLNLMMAAGAILRAHGDARRSMATTVSAAIANGVLDPILIFGLGAVPALGFDGAAIATALSRIVGAGVGLAPILLRHGGLAPIGLREIREDLGAIFGLATPAMLANVATPVGAAALTRIVAEYGDAAVAGYAIIGRISPVAFAVVFALSGAIGPIIGQNAGAGRYDRVGEALGAALRFLGVYVIAVSALLFVLREPLADAFGATGAGREIVYWFCGPLALAFYFNGALFVANANFNNLGRPFLSTQFNWGRHTLGAIAPGLLGAAVAEAPGALIGQALGGVVFAALALRRARRLIADSAAGREIAPRWPPRLRRIAARARSISTLWPHSSLKE